MGKNIRHVSLPLRYFSIVSGIDDGIQELKNRKPTLPIRKAAGYHPFIKQLVNSFAADFEAVIVHDPHGFDVTDPYSAHVGAVFRIHSVDDNAVVSFEVL